MASFQQALATIRAKASNDVELGGLFEDLIKIFLKNDKIQKGLYSRVWHYSEWAKEINRERGEEQYSTQDTGIDLVAKRSDGNGKIMQRRMPRHSSHVLIPRRIGDE